MNVFWKCFHCQQQAIVSYSVLREGKNIQNTRHKGKHAGGAHMQCKNLSRPASSPFPHILKTLPVSLYKGSSKMKCGWLTHLEKEDKRHHRALHKEHLTCWGPFDTTEGSASVHKPWRARKPFPFFSVNQGDSSVSKHSVSQPHFKQREQSVFKRNNTSSSMIVDIIVNVQIGTVSRREKVVKNSLLFLWLETLQKTHKCTLLSLVVHSGSCWDLFVLWFIIHLHIGL